VLDLAGEYKADCLGWQYQLGLLPLRPPSDFAEGLFNSTCRPESSGDTIACATEADQGNAIPMELMKRLLKAKGLHQAAMFHDVRWGGEHDGRFVREGDDIYTTVDVTFTQAALGATVTIPTLDGEERLELAPGTQPGQIVVLRGRGMPVLQGFGRGDQRVLVNVLVPHHLSDEQRRLLREFEEHADERTYAKGDTGLFEKLKSAFR